MPAGRETWGRGLVAGSLVLLLSACGGGGGGGDDGGASVDPAAAYSGATTRATVSQDNAEGLALGGFGGGRIGQTVGNLSGAGKRVATKDQGEHPVRQFAQVIQQAIGRMELHGKAAERRQSDATSAKGRVLQRVATFELPGEDGGYASYRFDIDDSTGRVSGSIDFHDYSSRGIVLSGKAHMRGTFDADRAQFRRYALSFESLSMVGSTYGYTLVGSLSWGLDFTASRETLKINMVLVEGSDDRTYWFRNYELFTTYGADSFTQTMSGRYYDPGQGYVDFASDAPLAIHPGDHWPSGGSVRSSGQEDTSVLLSFLPYSLRIEADTDGDGAADWQTERPTNERAPVAEAGPDQNVTQGATVLLDGSASHDPDGNPLSYSWAFQSCPESACPELTAANTAAPSYVADRAGTYVLRLTVNDGEAFSPEDTVSVSSSPVEATIPDFLQEQWQYGLYGTSIGQAGLLTADLDGDGAQEIIASASAGGLDRYYFWYIVRQAADGSYEQIWRSDSYFGPVVRLALADLSGDGRDDVVVGLSDGTVLVYDGPTRQELRRLKVVAPLSDLAVADVDGDGTAELVASDGSGVFVYAADTGGLKWSLTTGGGSSVAVGNVDADPAVEIVTTASGGKGYVIDATSRTVDWEYVNGFGAKVALGDLDADGRQEIVGAASWYKITLFDAERRTPTWEIPTDLDIDAVLVADTDGDGIPEILYGDRQIGGIHAIDAQTRTEKWSIDSWDGGISGIAMGDVDQDGRAEVLWGAGGYSSGADHLYVADPLTRTVEWQSKHVDGPLSAVAVGDVDDDGEDEVVMVSRESDSGYDEGIVHIFDAQTHVLEYQEKLGIMDWMGVRSVRIGDVDGDGKTEFVVTTANIYDGIVRVYDGATRTVKRETAGYDGNFFSALAIGDVDNDGRTEIVAGQGREHGGAPGCYLIVFDGDTLQEKWRSVNLETNWGMVYDVKLADLDGDGHVEIIASFDGTRLIVFDGVNHDLKLLLEHPARALEVADVDGDSASELLVGRVDGKVDVFDGVTFALEKTVSRFVNAPVDALRVADLDGDGTGEWLVTSGGGLIILDGETRGLKWRSRDLTGNLGLHNHLAVEDTDGDGRKEVFLGSDLALYQFE